MIDTTADFANSFTDFGVTATYNAADGSHAAITGIFDQAPVQNALGYVSGSGLSFLTPAANVADDPRGDALVIDGLTYQIEDCQPDGFDMVTLALNKINVGVLPGSAFSTGYSAGFGA